MLLKQICVSVCRLQRSAMLEMKSFHERLLKLVCSQDELVLCTTSHEHQQKLALDILSWITAIQMNDVGKRQANYLENFTCCSDIILILLYWL